MARWDDKPVPVIHYDVIDGWLVLLNIALSVDSWALAVPNRNTSSLDWIALKVAGWCQ